MIFCPEASVLLKPSVVSLQAAVRVRVTQDGNVARGQGWDQKRGRAGRQAGPTSAGWRTDAQVFILVVARKPFLRASPCRAACCQVVGDLMMRIHRIPDFTPKLLLARKRLLGLEPEGIRSVRAVFFRGRLGCCFGRRFSLPRLSFTASTT